ncbi:LuxR C-terminal-related transcriptional regulator [Streptomyces sp. NPDC058268]|uniref:LuxR C-terminal-related transcriptional regulator n=1 Tax=Streptomyces sp. NPDC058268 TaxID=3346413 RepID=UPI0036ED7402
MKTHSHGPDELCEAGSTLYALALTEGRIRSEETGPAPCLIGLGLLQADADDTEWLRPTAPAVALPRLLEGIEKDIAHHRHRGAQLATAFESLMALVPRLPASEGPPAITVLTGLPHIQKTVAQALSDSSREMLSIQPGGHRPPEALAQSLADARGVLARGGRMRTLYQHTSRHSLSVFGYHDQLQGDTEVRTLDEVTERLFVFDRVVAFVPANRDRSVALEIRLPALVEYLAAAFDCLWSLATPMYPHSAQLPSDNGITTRQQAIAHLLVDGHTDSEIAVRLGMNVRTCRAHIAKIAATLNSRSRAQLGYLIGRSGMLRQNH